MGEGVAMRHTFNHRVEDAKELGPQEGGGLSGEELDPSPLRPGGAHRELLNDPDHGLDQEDAVGLRDRLPAEERRRVGLGVGSAKRWRHTCERASERLSLSTCSACDL